MAKVKICEKCMREAIQWKPIRVYLKHYDPDSYEKDVWVCEHMLKRKEEVKRMKTYDVVFKVRVRAESEAKAKVKALEVLTSPGIVHYEAEVKEVKRLYCNVKKGSRKPSSFDFCY